MTSATRRRQRGLVTFDATGGGASTTQGFSTSIGVTWSHTASGNTRAVVVGFTCRSGSQAPSGQTRTVTYGGVAMTKLGTAEFGGDMFCDLWFLLNPPVGAQTVSVNVSSGSNTGRGLAGNSVSYNGVGSSGAVVTANGTSSSAAQSSVASAAGEMISQLFGATSAFQTGYTQTQRSTVQSTDGFADLLIGDAPGTAAVSFSSTLNTSTTWGGVAARLMPART